jgi:hypothetical protein
MPASSPTILALPLNGSLASETAAGVGTATGVGTMRYVDGPTPNPRGTAINWISNTKVATTTSPHAALSSAVITRIAGSNDAPMGGLSGFVMQTVTSATSGSGVRWRSTGSLRGRRARSFAGGIWVKGTAGATLYVSNVVLYVGGSSTSGTVSNFTATGKWQWVKTAGVTTATAADLDYVTIDIRTSASLVTTFYSQGATVIDGLVPPDAPIDGDDADADWLGAANVSPSRLIALDRAPSLEKATTNYAVNPYAVSTGGGWTVVGTLITRTFLTDANFIHPDGPLIQTAARFTWTGANNSPQDIAIRTVATVAGENVSHALLVRSAGTATGKTLRLAVYETGVVTPVRASIDTVLTGAPQLISVTGAMIGAGTDVRLQAYFVSGSASGDILDMTAAQQEWEPMRTLLTPMFSPTGTILSNYAWTGTAHNSTSTRAATSITIPAPAGFTTAVGSAWIKAFLSPQPNGHEHTIWGVNYDGGGSGKDGFNIRQSSTDGTQVTFWYQNTSGTQFSAVAGGFTPNAWNTIYVSWDATTISLHGPSGVSKTARSGIINNINAQPFAFGYRALSTDRYINGPVAQAMFFDRLLDEHELEQLATYSDIDGIGFNSLDKWRAMDMAIARRLRGSIGVAGLPGSGLTSAEKSSMLSRLTALEGENLGSHNDTLFTSVANGHVVTWNSTTSKWVNQAVVQGLATVSNVDITVNTVPVGTLDFDGAQWLVTQPTTGKIQIAPQFGTGASQFAEGNHAHNQTLVGIGENAAISNVTSGSGNQMATTTIGPLASGVVYDVVAIGQVEGYSTTGGPSSTRMRVTIDGNTKTATSDVVYEAGVNGPKMFAHTRAITGAGANITSTIELNWVSGTTDPTWAWIMVTANPRR